MKSDREFLKHILDEIQFVRQETKGLDFEKEVEMFDRITFDQKIIGTLLYKISP